MSWQDKVSPSFVVPKTVRHTVNGQDFEFSPLSVEMLFRLRTVATPLTKALAGLFGRGAANDVGREFNNVNDAKNGIVSEKTTVQPITPELAKLRAQQTDEAAAQLADILTDRKNALVLAAVVFDSVRDVFPRKPAEKDLSEFLERLSVPDLVQWVQGVVLANRESFGPLVPAGANARLSEVLGAAGRPAAAPTETKEGGKP